MKATAIDKNVTEAQEMISAVLKQVAATNVSVVAATEKLLVLDEKATSSEREQAKDRKGQVIAASLASRSANLYFDLGHSSNQARYYSLVIPPSCQRKI